MSQGERDAVIALCRKLAEEISEIHATTLAGLWAKALAVEWFTDTVEECRAVETLSADIRTIANA